MHVEMKSKKRLEGRLCQLHVSTYHCCCCCCWLDVVIADCVLLFRFGPFFQLDAVAFNVDVTNEINQVNESKRVSFIFIPRLSIAIRRRQQQQQRPKTQNEWKERTQHDNSNLLTHSKNGKRSFNVIFLAVS